MKRYIKEFLKFRYELINEADEICIDEEAIVILFANYKRLKFAKGEKKE